MGKPSSRNLDRESCRPAVFVASSATHTIDEVVARVEAELAARSVGNPREEAREIVAALLDLPRHLVVPHTSAPMDLLLLARALRAARCRALGMPFQYAVGRASFRHLTLVMKRSTPSEPA